MCGPALAWDWFVLDLAYGLVLLGGGIILRARSAMPATWVLFGMLGSLVGGFLFFETYSIQTTASAMAAASAQNAVSMLSQGC